MFVLKAKVRSVFGKKTEDLRKEGLLPAVLYGPGLKNFRLEIDSKEFIRIFQEAGRTSFLQLEVEQEDSKKPFVFLVLIHDIQKDPLSLALSHVDFYQPSSTKEIKAKVPLVFEGE